ncbi:hypothetical protein D0Z03_003027 [Geotrichum reessii]|nr:hypothetical protein D0Z03_003027 [Galactomyces reessii]
MSDSSSASSSHPLPLSSTNITTSTTNAVTPKPMGLQSNIVVVDSSQQQQLSAEDEANFLKHQLIGSAAANSFAIDPALDPYNNKKLKSSAYSHHQQQTQQQQHIHQSPSVSTSNSEATLAVAAADAVDQQGFYQPQLQQQQIHHQPTTQHFNNSTKQQHQIQAFALHSDEQSGNSNHDIYTSHADHSHQQLQRQKQQRQSKHQQQQQQQQQQPEHQQQQQFKHQQQQQLKKQHPQKQQIIQQKHKISQQQAAAAAAAAVVAYPGMDIMASNQIQYSQFGDPMEVAAAAIGIEFDNIRHPPNPSSIEVAQQQQQQQEQQQQQQPQPPSQHHQSPQQQVPQQQQQQSQQQQSMLPQPSANTNYGQSRKRKISSITDMPTEVEVTTPVPSLAELANRVRQEENGSSAEKFKQNFAMAWISKNCELSSEAAVPRNRLRSLSQFLPVHLTNTLNNYDRMLQAKLKPARAFCNLLDRLIRANEAGLNAGKILVDPVETRKMRDDWSRFVDPKTIVMREVPCGSVEAQRILGEEVIQLLEDYINDDNKLSFKTGANGEAAVFSKSETIVFKWAQYLSSLPWRFPSASPRLFLLCMSGLLTAALRDISMNGGEGFGAWWVVRCWVDEWMGWSAEMGGFLAMNVDEEELHTTDTGSRSKKAKVTSSESNSTLSSASGSTTTVTSNFGSEELAFSTTVAKPSSPVSGTVDVSIASSTDANDDDDDNGHIQTNGNGTVVTSNNGSRGNGSAPRLVFLRQTASVKHVPIPPTTTPAYEEGLEGMENLLVDVDDMDKTGLVL